MPVQERLISKGKKRNSSLRIDRVRKKSSRRGFWLLIKGGGGGGKRPNEGNYLVPLGREKGPRIFLRKEKMRGGVP